MGRQPSLIQGGGGFDALMRCYSAQIPDLTPYFTEHSIAIVACFDLFCRGGMRQRRRKKCHPWTEGMNCEAGSQDGSS